jgi:adenylosuccinate lyase
VKADYRRTQHSLMPLLKELERLCEGGNGQYVHFGPTTQDIEDTGTILELKDAYKIILRDVREIEAILIDLSRRYRDLVMCGRTHGQQALPITLGLKFAIWLSETRRHIERFKEMRSRLFVGMLHGGAGTMAGLGPRGMEVMESMMADLGLGTPRIGWGNARDCLAEYVVLVSMAASTLGKMANEIFELSKTETGELTEPFPEGYIGSSTMPHKLNPEISEQVVMLSRLIRSHAGIALEAIICEHERDSRSWRTDWLTLPESSMFMGAILAMMKSLLGGLVVHEDRIAKNLVLTNGLLFSEGLMFLLGEKIGKQRAHHVIGQAALQAHRTGRPITEILRETPEISDHLTGEELESIMDYRRHVGFAAEMVDNVCAESERRRETDGPYLDP